MIRLLKSLITLCLYHVFVIGGVIYPDNANPVQMERTNDGATSSYTFYMSLSNRLPAQYGIIKIMFPISTYSDPSRNPSLSSSDFGQFSFIQTQNNQVTLYQNQLYQYQDGSLTSNYLSASWDQNGRYLQISGVSDAINAGSLQVSIKFIRNPVNCADQVSGNFQIQTFINSTKVDENLSFGTVTYSSPYVLSNQNTISNDGSNLGGFVTNYKVTFSTTVTLPANSWFRMRFPNANVLGDTTCQQVDTKQDLTCTNNGDNVLIFSGITNALSPNTYTLQVRNITNPTYTGFFNQFVLECLFPGTNNVLMLFYNGLTGITINPGQIKSVSISGNPLNMNLRIDYTILFTPTNTVPQGGKIQITFPTLAPSATDPNTRSFQLDSTCRVTSGLTPLTGLQNVGCVSSGSVLTITNFQIFYSQQIQVLIYAINPGRAAIYSPFVIQTYLFDKTSSQFYVIDENTNAGSVSISSVNSLTYVQIDFFTTMVNGTFSQAIPLDFRLYPNPGNELPLSTSTQQHEISLQLPLLWRNKNADFTMYYQAGDVPSVTFGNEPAYYANPSLVAKYSLQVYQFKTPSSTNYVKFPAGQGLAQCDLPISINNVIMPPFGGKYQFRVLTFYGGTHYVNQPLEQDLYTMDIAIPNFNSASVTTTGSESGDQDNVIIATLITGMQIPYEGAINFNMTTKTIFSENTSKWDSQLGQSMTISQVSVNVPCSIYVNGDLSGFSNSVHPNARCYVFKGSELQNVILQVRGFSQPIGASSTIKIYVPNIQLCEDVQKQCFVTINSAYTADLSDPYILNTIYVKVVNSINTASTVTPASNTINCPSPTFATPTGESKEICLYATWDLGSSFYTTPFSTGDSIIIIFPSYRFTYWKSDVQSINYQFTNGVSGSVTYINFYTTKETYYLIQLTGNVPVGNNLLLTNIKNANDIHDFGPTNNINIVQGVKLQGKYWQKGIKVSYVQWAISPGYMDGGILFTNLSILPNITPSPIRTVATDMEWQAEIVYKIDFTNCRPVPQGGQFNIFIPTGSPAYLSINSNCNVQQGLKGISQLTLQSSISCQIIQTTPGNYKIQLSQFQAVSQQTAISVIFRATNPVKQASSWNPGSYTITSNDASSSVINFTSTNYVLPALTVAGPSIFPSQALWQSFYITDRPARQGERGYFYMKFTSPLAFSSGSTLTIDFGGAVSRPTQVDNTIYNFNFQTMAGYLYCALNNEIAEDCIINAQTVTMKIPITSTVNGIQQNIEYSLQMGYRGNDDSTSTRDGFLMNQAGTYILSAMLTDGSQTVQTQKAFNVMAPSFVNFWVWSINKLVTDTTDTKCLGGSGKKICGRTLVAFVFSTSFSIPPSIITAVSQTAIILEFATYINSAFPNVFASDLGTGLPQRSNVPCEGLNIPIQSGFDTLSCQLYLGTNPNPSQIIIRQFDTIPSGSYEIHIPNIFNPTTPKVYLQVDMLVQTTSLVTGVTIPIYQNYYQLVNMTNVIQSYLFHTQPLVKDLTTQITPCKPIFQTITTIDTIDDLKLCFYTSQDFDMQGGDYILFQFPSMWILPDINNCLSTISTNYGQFAYCYTYPSSQQVLLVFTQPAKGLVLKQQIVTGTITLRTPPYRALTPTVQSIFGYTYWRSRLVTQFQIPNFDQALTEKTIPAANMQVTADNTIQNQLAEYKIRYVVVSDIPAGGCIQIIIPLEFKNLQKENICRNAITQGSNFDPYGYQFQCDLIINASGVQDYLLVHSFGPFKLDYTKAGVFQKRNGTTLVVNFRVQNPNVASPAQWQIKQWYKKENPLNLLVAVGSTNSPTLTAPPTITYWEKLLLTRKKLYTGDFGVLELKIQVPVNLNAGQSVTIQMPAGFTQQTDSQLFCYWDLTVYYNQKYPAYTCTLSGGNLLTIQTPLQSYIDLYNVAQGGSTGQPIAANSYLVIGISTIDQYNGNNGIVMPSTSGFYSFTITFPNGSSPYVATKQIYVPLKPTFTYFSPTTLINNPNEKTVIDIYVLPSITCDNFKLYVPVVDQFNRDLFDEDLGTGFTSQVGGTPINCQYQNGAVQTALSCKLIFGDKGLGTPAIITITGISFTAGTPYLISIDQIKNPNVIVDGRDVDLILEGYLGAAIQSSDINYDFTFKYVNTLAATDVTSQPAYSKVTMGGTGAGPKEYNINYMFTIQQKVFAAESNPEKYDYFIIEFPFYAFNKQPLTVSCSPGSCRQLQGWNWVIWKYDSNYSVGSSISLTVSGLQNVKIASTTVQLIGYTVKNRVVVDKRYFQNLDPVTPISPSAGDFTITTPDYPNSQKIPKNQMTRYLFQLKLPIELLANQGVIDFKFPTGYTTQNYCSDTFAYPLPAFQDYISCVNNQVAQTISISGFGSVPANQIIQIETWAQNPSTAVASPSFTVDIYQDAARTMKLTTFSANGPPISTYDSTVFAKHNPEYINSIRQGKYGEFNFYLKPGISLTENDYIQLIFPNSDVSAQSYTYLVCGFNNNNVNIESALCKVTQALPLTIRIYGPVDSPLVATTMYLVYVTIENGAQQGLQFTGVGETKFQVTNSNNLGSLTDVYFTIYPTANFGTLATLETTFENSGSIIDLVVTVQTTVSVPSNGQIVVAFPKIAEDGLTPLFGDFLGKTGLNPGSIVNCAGKPSSITTQKCTITSNFRKVMVSQRLSSGLNTAYSLLINDITLPTQSASTGSISIEVYTTTQDGTILEAFIFRNIITPYNPVTSPPSATPTTTNNTPGTNIVVSTGTFTFSSVNLGATANSFSGDNDRIVVKFPIGYDLTSSTFTYTVAYAATEYLGIGNIMIIRLANTLNQGSGTFAINNVVSPSTPLASPQINVYTVVGGVYNFLNTYQPSATTTPTFTSPSLTLPYYTSKNVPQVININFTPSSNLLGANTVYFAKLNSPSNTPTGSRIGQSLPCSIGSDPVYCQLVTSGTYFGQTISNPTIIISGIDDVTAGTAKVLTIYNLQEYKTANSISITFSAIDIVKNYIRFQSTINVSQTTNTINVVPSNTVANTYTNLQSLDNLVFSITTNLSSYTAGSFIILFFDNFPCNTLTGVNSLSASIDIDGSSVNPCTFDSISLAVICQVSQLATTSINLNMNSILLPTILFTTSTTNTYQVIGYTSAKVAFSYLTFYPQTQMVASSLTSVSSKQITNNVIELQFTTQLQVPATGYIEITLNSSPTTVFQYNLITSQFTGAITAQLAGSKITISGFSLMNLGAYKFKFGFQDASQVPQISNIATKQNGFDIETSTVTQTTNTPPTPGTITVNILQIIESQTLLLKFTTQTTFSNGQIKLDFGSSIASATFSAQIIDYTNISSPPQFVVSTQYVYIQNIGTFTAGSIIMKLFFSTMPTQLSNVSTISDIYDVIDTVGSSQTIMARTFMFAQNWLSLQSLQYYSSVSVGGSNVLLTFRIKLKTNLSATAEQLMITFPNSIDIATMASNKIRLKCNVKMPFSSFNRNRSYKCFFQTLTSTFLVFQGFALTANTVYDIEILRLGDTTSQRYMWVLPSSPQVYYFTIDRTNLKAVQDTTGATITQTDSIIMEIFSSMSPSAMFSNYDGSVSKNTLYNVQFNSGGSFGFIDIEFPINQDQGSTSVSLFAQDLGTGLQNGKSISCQDLSANLGINVKYRLFYGQSTIQNPSKIRILLSSSGNININIQNLINPSTVNVSTQIRVKAGTGTGSLSSLQVFRYAVYTLSYSPATATLPSPSFSPATASSLVQISINGLALTSSLSIDGNSILRFSYDPLQYSATMSSPNSVANFQTNQSVNFCITSASIASPYNLQVNNIYTPPIVGTYTYSSYIVTEIRNRKVRKVFTGNVNQALSAGGNFVQNQQIIANSYNAGQNNVRYYLTYDLMQNQVSGNIIQLIFPSSQYTIAASLTCSIQDKNSLASISSTCTSNTSTNSFVIQLSTQLTSGTSYLIKVIVNNPASSGITNNFVLKFFTDNTSAVLQSTVNVSGVTIVNQLNLVAKIYQPQTNVQFCQSQDTCPIQFTAKLTSALNMGVDSLRIATSYVSTLIGLQSQTKELQCWINELAAYNCYILSNVIYIFAPIQTTFAVGTILNVNIKSWRDQRWQVTQNPIQDFILKPTWTQYQTTPLIFKDVPINQYTGGSQSYIFKKDWIFVNQAFNRINFAFACSISTTINSPTILRVRFQMPTSISLPDALPATANWGQFVLYLETYNEINQQLFPYNLESRFIKNGQEIDCICVNCIASMKFLCYIQYGGSAQSAPASISIHPQQTTSGSTTFIFSFPKINLPATVNNYARIGLKAIQFDSTNKVVNEYLELLMDFIFYTNPNNIVNAASAPLNFPAGHRVGDPMQVSWNYNIPYTQALTSRDRIVMTTTTPTNIIEQPIRPGTALTTTANVGTVRIYPLINWLEIEFSTNMPSNAKTAITYNFKNMPYQITGGVNYELYAFSQGEQRLVQPYNNIPFANPNVLYFKNFQTTVQYISQPNTVTFIFQPYNKIPIGGYISIYWGKLNAAADSDWLFLSNYCVIITGLSNAQCIVVSSERRIYLYDWDTQYDPVVGGIIKFVLQIQNSGNPGNRVNFSLTTYWDLTGFNNRPQVTGYDPNQSHIIDQDNSYANFNVLSIVLLQLTILDRVQEPIAVCGGNRGPIVLKFQFRKNYVYPSDYIEINFFNQIQQLAAGEELICYFADTGNPQLVFVKTFRCDLLANGVIWAFIPEETPINSGSQYLLYLTVRTNNVYTWGIQVNGPSAIKWTRLSTSNENQASDYYQEVAWIEAKIPPCPFDPNVFRVYSYSHEANTLSYANNIAAQANAEQYLYTYINVTLATVNNPIASGLVTSPTRTRIVFQFQTHNGIFPSWDEDPTGQKLTTAGGASCGGMYNKVFGTPFTPDGQDLLSCTLIPGSGQLPTTPAYIIMQGHPQIVAGDAFNIGLGRIKNPNKITDGTVFTNAQVGQKTYHDALGYRYQTSAHLNIFIEQLQPDGTFYPINSQWRYYIIPQLNDANPPVIMGSGQFQIMHYDTRVNFSLRNVTINIIPLGITLNKYQSAVVVQYGYPYEMVNNARCYQHDQWINQSTCSYYNPTCAIPHGPVGCTFLPQSRWVVYSNNLDIVTNQYMVREIEYTGQPYYRMNPPFTYNYLNPQSQLRAWVYDNYQTVIMRVNQMINPVQMPCGVVMETTAADNPQNREVLYRIGLYIYTRTSTMKTIWLFAPTSFQNIRSCKIKKGVVLVDFNDINNDIKCDISYSSSNWFIQISNFYYNQQYSDGLIILELLVTNPFNSGWTTDWICRTFSDNSLQINNLNFNANGKTWVGKFVPFPNLFRVYRNTVSFQNRRAGINQYAEMNMRIIPRAYHPQTDDTQSTQIQVWMPLTYDIPNGGTNVCSVDHIYHQDIDGQYCQITSDRKIFANTNRNVGLMDKCGLVFFTTQNSINNQNGVKMPPVAGADQFQVFITSKDASGNVSQEYSNQQATTNPSYLSTAAYPTGHSYKYITNVMQSQIEARVILQFYTPRDIPPGYDTSVGISDPSLKNPIAYLDIMFNTIDYIEYWGATGWNLNLVSASPKNSFACKAYSGLIAQTGQKLKCQIIPSTQVSIYNPVIVRVSNFQSILANSFIELHLLNVPCPPQTFYNNDGFIKTRVFQVNGDGSQNDIIGSSQFTLGSPAQLINWYYWSSNRASVTPNQVGAYSTWTFQFDQMYDYLNAYQGCFDAFGNPMFSFLVNTILVIKIPNVKFVIVDDGKITATFANVPAKIWIYEDTNQIFVQVPQNTPCGSGGVINSLQIYQLRNAAFRFPTPYAIQIDAFDPSSRTIIRSYLYTPISNPAVGSFVSLTMFLSKYYADERYVTYTYGFTPSYDVPPGSLITITLPNRAALNFPNFGSSIPKETCQVSDSTSLSVSSCGSTFSPTGFSIVVLKDIPEQTSLTVWIVGTRNNPTYAQQTLPTDFQITITHPLGYQINSGNFPVITYLPKRSTSFLYLTMSGTSYFQNIITDYTFVIQSTSDLPIGGYIVMNFPINFLERALTLPPLKAPDQITGSWTSSSLTYTSSWSGPTGQYYTLTITPTFVWPAKSSMIVTFKAFPNPISTLQTNLFSVATIYDGKNVDQTDPTDNSLIFNYSPQPPTMLATFSFSPKNEASLSTYKIDITPSKNIPTGAVIQFQFDTNLYPSTLSSANQQVSCLLNGVASTCTVQNGVVNIPVTQDLNANVPISIQLNNIMNPSQGSSKIVGQVSYGGDIIQYKPDIGPVETKSPPNNLQLIQLSTSTNSLLSRARYTFCVQTSNTISVTDQVFIFFPSQYSFKSQYTCSITPQHSNSELNYAQTSTSPLCTTFNDQRKISITGQTAAKTSSNAAQLCYYVNGIENPSIPGTTNNFIIQIYDPVNSIVKSQTSGLISTQTTLSFYRKGFQIIVGSIPDLPKGASSNDITITLEIAVSYIVTATPFLQNFEFIPPVIQFDPTQGKQQTFKIKPLDSAIVGSQNIVWTKSEATSQNQFSDIQDTPFNLIAKPYANSLKAVLQTTVSRAALYATSLPIQVVLNQPASKVLTISMYTKNHQQDSLIVFNPTSMVFIPGQVSQTFTYTTKNGAVSGQIMFQLDSFYQNIYVMPYNTLSFEILDIDNAPPIVRSYYIESMDRTYMYLRISCDESVNIYSILTLQGTLPPTSAELKDSTVRAKNGNKTDVMELYMRNSSYIAPVTVNFIYYDSYLHFTGLEEQTSYLLYFYAEDLSGNASPVQSFSFQTLKKQNPCAFSIRLNQTIDDSTLYSAFGLITTLPANRFQITNKPSKFNIEGVIETEVKDIIGTVPMVYSFILLQNKTADEVRPLQTVNLLQNQFSLLQTQLSSGFSTNVVDPTYSIIEHAYELIVLPQEFKYTPFIVNSTEDSAKFQVSLKYSGIGYGIVQLASATKPTARQIKYGLNSTNFLLPESQYQKIEFIFASSTPQDQQNITNKFAFSGLLDNSNYVAYFIGENSQLVNPDLMSDDQILAIPFQTSRESIIIPSWFRADIVSADLLKISKVLMKLILIILMIS